MSAAQVQAALFVEEQHPRAEGGQFGPKSGGSGAAKPARKAAPAKTTRKRRTRRTIPAGMLGFDGVRGTGYGLKGGDKRVRALQEQLNRLGLTDSRGRELRIDGELGPLTTQAIKAAQVRLGMRPTGVIAPAFIDRLKATRVLPAAKTPAVPAKRAPRARVRAKHDPSQPRDDHGRWTDGGIGKLVASLSKVSAGGQLQPRRNSEALLDWATRRSDGSFGLEATGDDGETVGLNLSADELGGLHAALTEALGGEDPGFFAPGGLDDDLADPRGFDWSIKHEDADGELIYSLEVGGHVWGSDGEPGAIQIEMSDRDMRDWHTALTVTLIRAELDQTTAPVSAAGIAPDSTEAHVFRDGICITCEGGA